MSEEWKKQGDIWKALMSLRKQLISEFVEDLNDLPDSKWKRRYLEKWEEKLK